MEWVIEYIRLTAETEDEGSQIIEQIDRRYVLLQRFCRSLVLMTTSAHSLRHHSLDSDDSLMAETFHSGLGMIPRD